jgi:hypothetical protein
MDEQTEKRILEHIAEIGARVRKIDERAKQLSSEIDERQAEKARLVLERDREVYLIKDIETLLDDKAREKSWSAQQRPKREGDPLSIPTLMQQVLEKHPDGLQVPALLAEVRKIGFQSDAKKPIGVLNSVLHTRTDLFSRRKIPRGVLWFLKKYEHVLPAETVSVKIESSVPAEPRERSGSGKIVLKDKAQIIAENGPLKFKALS